MIKNSFTPVGCGATFNQSKTDGRSVNGNAYALPYI